MQIIVTLLKKSPKKFRKAYYKIIFTCTYFPECHSTMQEHYSQPEELLADDSFLNWYFKTGGGEGSAWDEWIAADAGNKELAFRAVELLELTRLPEKTVPAERIRQASDRLLADINRPENGFVKEEAGILKKNSMSEAAHRTRSLPMYGRWVAAACLVGVLVAGVLYWAGRSGRSEIRTEYGQLGDQVLPDGTEVAMNANSRLKYTPGWKPGVDREVWVSGEAFFHVQKTPEKSRFIVHLNDCDVIVTGTRFNVVNRPGKENVMLQEGSVILHAASGSELNLRPGDFVAVDKNGLEKASARPDSLMAWRDRRLILDNTPLPELVNIVRDQYGVVLQLSGDSTAKKTVTGILRNNNLEVLLKALQMTGDFEVIGSQDSGGITIVAHSTRN
jgi:ferric-dicitrate binding protein FerR (iron transport regulator)